MREDGGLNVERLRSFVDAVADLRHDHREVILVSSGSIGLGAERLGITNREDLVAVKQACAAVGQSRLMGIYSDEFEKRGLTAAQVLLTEEDFSNRKRYLNLKNTISKLLELGAIPIINENDTVSTAELETIDPESYRKANFGDNDKLSALVASKVEADLLILLTDVEGLYSANPTDSKDSKLISTVEKVTPEIEKLASGKSKAGRGGMHTKLDAADIATHSGCAVVIASGKAEKIINKIFSGEALGTFFMPLSGMAGKRRWIAYATTVTAALVVGARKALVEQQASLLPAGVREVRGEFERGDVVSILNEHGEEFARGMVNYSSEETRKIYGQQSGVIDKVIKNRNYDALIKRENMAILGDSDA